MRINTRRIFVLFGILLLIAGQFISAAGQNDRNAVTSKDIKDGTRESFSVAMKAEPPNLDPHNHTTLVGFGIQRLIYDTLVAQDENGNIIPKLAKSWDVISDIAVRFYLRDDVYFHNGEKLTAEDVRFSIQRSATNKSSRTLFSAFDGVKTNVIDDYTIDVYLKYPFAPIYNYLASPRGDIISKKALEEMGESEFGRNPVGSGPFVFSKWVTGDRIELTRNTNYWGPEPKYNNFVARFITEPTNRAIELETKGVDAIFDVSPSDIARLKKTPNVKVLQGPGYKTSFITMSFAAPEFEDIRIRKALAHALDVEAIVKAVYKDGAQVADSVISPRVFGYKKVGPYEYNPELSRQLLKEAGFEKGLNLTFYTNEDSQFIAVAEVAQNMWKQVGINVTIRTYDQATYLAMASEGKVALGMSSSTPSTGDPDHALIVWPSTYGGQLQANDPKIDAMLEKGKSTYDPADRKKVYEEIQDYIWSLYRMIPIAFSDAVYATMDYVENFECHPGTTPNLSTVTFTK